MKDAPEHSNAMLGPDNKKFGATLKHMGKTKKGGKGAPYSNFSSTNAPGHRFMHSRP